MRGRLAFLVLIIVQSVAAAQSIPTFLTTPTLTIGDSVGDSSVVFGRLTDAKRLSDGRIVAAVCGNINEVRGFDASGKPAGTLRLMDQPAQRSLVRLFVAGGDTLGAFENLNTRLTLIAPNLTQLRTITIPNPDTATFQGRPRPTRLDVIGRLRDGSFIGRIAGPSTPGAGVHRRTLSLYRFDAAGKLMDSMTVPGHEANSPPGARSSQAIRLERMTTVTLLPDRVVIGNQASPFLSEHGLDLKPVRRVETITRPIAVTDSMKEAWTKLALARGFFPVNGVTPVWSDAFADSTPAFRDLVAGTDGRIWVQDPVGADSYPLIWTAYQGGRPTARAQLPPRFYPTQFGSDWVLGLAFDTTAVDRLQLLKLSPGALTDPRLTPREAAPPNRPRCGAWTSR